MKVEKKVVIEIDGEDLSNLKTGLKKVIEEITKPGFKNNTITNDEVEIIKKIHHGL